MFAYFDCCCLATNFLLLRIVYVRCKIAKYMRARVITACLLLLTVSLAGCISDSTVEEISDPIEEISDAIDEVTEAVEVLGCMDQTALNYDVDATNDSKLCLSMEQLIQAEDVFWNSWSKDAIDNLTEPVGYRLMVDESITWGDGGENITNHSMAVQEVFASDYYNQEIEYRGCLNPNTRATNSDNSTKTECADWDCKQWCQCATGPGGDTSTGGEVSSESSCHYSSQTVFDNAVQVENFNDGEWDNYSMETASTYDEFRGNLEHGPGIRSSNNTYVHLDGSISSESSARSENGTIDHHESFKRKHVFLAMGFPTLDQVEFDDVISRVIETSLEGDNSQQIHYLGKNNTTDTHVEIMGEMTEDGFKITEYANNRSSNVSPGSVATGSNVYYNSMANNNRSGTERCSIDCSVRASFNIILLESVGSELRFGEFEFTEPANSRGGNASTSCSDTMRPCLAIPFYFETIPPVVQVDAENTTSRSEDPKGLNALEVEVFIAGPSGPYGMEGSLDDYFLVLSNCTIDNLTAYGSDSAAAISQEASARSGNGTQTMDRSGVEKSMFGSDGNICSSEVKVSLLDIAGVPLVPLGPEGGGQRGEGDNSSDFDSFAGIVTFIDSDSSGTLSEGDRFEFGENFTELCDGLDDDCDGFNVLRLYSKSAERYSDENIDVTDTTRAAVHDTAMSSIRGIRAVAADDSIPFLDSVRTAMDHNTTRSNRHT